MGRGRAKAKQTKVARRLKYGVPQTDLERLEAELQGRSGEEPEAEVEEGYDEDPYADDPYAAYVEPSEDAEDDEA
jgi:hypothetical protein